MFIFTKKVFMVLATIVAISSFSLRSQAIVAVASWNPILMGVGLGVATGAIGIGTIVGTGAEHVSKPLGLGVAIVFGFAGAIGMIILSDGTESLSFSELDETYAKELGIGQKYLDDYNAEVDQVNAIAEQVAYDLSLIENPKVEDSRDAWLHYKSQVSETTFNVMATLMATSLKTN